MKASAVLTLGTLLATHALSSAAGMAASAAADPAAAPTVADADNRFMRQADDFLDNFFFPFAPTEATSAGVHRYDDKLEDYSRAGIDRQIAELQKYARRFGTVDESTLSERVRGDCELLKTNVQSTLLTLQVIKPWQKDPDFYSSAMTASAYTIMERDFAPVSERLRLLIAREQQMPAMLQAARVNLSNPPEIYVQIALEQLPGDIRFFEHDLPEAFKDATDSDLQKSFRAANGRVLAELRSYQGWIDGQLKPRAHGDFRLGAATFAAKLRYDEMVDTPLERLLQIGLEDMRRNQAEFDRVARQLEPQKSPQQVLAELAADHPPPQQLLQSFRATLGGLVSFIKERQIVTIPSDLRPQLRETPPFMRATTFASMDTPGPFEPKATEAYFNVTLPDPSWDAKRVAGFMAQFSYPVINSVATHEAYPGHYVQFLWMHHVQDRVRKVIGAASNAEGWAHYCEQMMLDEGFGSSGASAVDQRQLLMLRLGQLQDALLRDARYVVGIRLHTQGMSLEEAIDLFVKQGYQSREVGEAETKRGTSNPTYLYYTLGKLQIMKLRADLQAREGSSFRLKDFHDQFLQQGFPPIRIVRRALLHDDSPTL